VKRELDFVVQPIFLGRRNFGGKMSTSQRIAAVLNDVQLRACNEEISQQCTLFSGIFLSYGLYTMDKNSEMC
jgi:hypothetical protein